MNKKIVIQIILFLIIILLIGLFFFEVEDKQSAKKNAGLPTVSNEDFSNLIVLIKFKSLELDIILYYWVVLEYSFHIDSNLFCRLVLYQGAQSIACFSPF